MHIAHVYRVRFQGVLQTREKSKDCLAIRVRPDMQGLYARHVKLRRNGNSIEIATMSNPIAVQVQFVGSTG